MTLELRGRATPPGPPVWTTPFASNLSTQTDKTPQTTRYSLATLLVPCPCTITGMSFVVGSVGGTDNVKLALWDPYGRLVGVTPDTLVGATPNVYQDINFAAAKKLVIPGIYTGGVKMNGTTARFRCHITVGNLRFATSFVDSADYATNPDPITVPSAWTSGQGPCMAIY